MKDGQYYSILGWMGKYLGLRGNDLICFAVIYGFSMDGESQFKGNLDYLASCMFASRPTVLLSLKHLIEHNLILKYEDVVNGKKRCFYSTNIIYEDGDFDVIDPSKEPLSMTSKEPLPDSSKEPLPKNYNNIDYNNKEKKEEKNNKKRFSKPTIQEIEAYIKEKNLHFDAEHFFDYYESKGWVVGKSPMKDWKAACRTWEQNRKKQSVEELPTEEIPADDVDHWQTCQLWMKNYAPRIAEKVTYKDFAKMRAMVMFNSYVFATILKAIDRSDYDGDIVKEFERLTDLEEYSKMILA